MLDGFRADHDVTRRKIRMEAACGSRADKHFGGSETVGQVLCVDGALRLAMTARRQ